MVNTTKFSSIQLIFVNAYPWFIINTISVIVWVNIAFWSSYCGHNFISVGVNFKKPIIKMNNNFCNYMSQVWDETLAKTAEQWASTCIWEHGPRNLLRVLGQNLSVRTGRYVSSPSFPVNDQWCFLWLFSTIPIDIWSWMSKEGISSHHNEIWCYVWIVYRYRSILQLVKPWYDEVKDYSFPYPRDCNPRCPLKCYGPMCTHYTQVSWLWWCLLYF